MLPLLLLEGHELLLIGNHVGLVDRGVERADHAVHLPVEHVERLCCSKHRGVRNNHGPQRNGREPQRSNQLAVRARKGKRALGDIVEEHRVQSLRNDNNNAELKIRFQRSPQEVLQEPAEHAPRQLAKALLALDDDVSLHNRSANGRLAPLRRSQRNIQRKPLELEPAVRGHVNHVRKIRARTAEANRARHDRW
eukprot:Amastigsp_a757_35.p2 type:complete len:194 gc:universal Amastigsp_a757_35:223-804(+)